MTRLAAAVLAILAVTSVAHADACRRRGDDKTGRPPSECPPEERLKPYDPDRVKSGSGPGFIDLGNGTEVRVGGRVRTEFDVRH